MCTEYAPSLSVSMRSSGCENSPVRLRQADGETLGELPHGLEKRRNIDAYTYVLPHTSVAIIITHDYYIVMFFSAGLASDCRGVEWVCGL